MEKINSIDTHQISQEMQRMIALSGGFISPASNAGGTPDVAFSAVFKQGLNNVNDLQLSAKQMQQAIDMGESDDLMATMLESQKASISFSAMVEVRNKLTNALDQLINMPL